MNDAELLGANRTDTWPGEQEIKTCSDAVLLHAIQEHEAWNPTDTNRLTIKVRRLALLMKELERRCQ
jgi:hypothetical protein